MINFTSHFSFSYHFANKNSSLQKIFNKLRQKFYLARLKNVLLLI